MPHFVLTRSAYGPAWDRNANARRLRVTRAVTARLMAAQTTVDWTWIVLLDPRDPLIKDRLAVFTDHAPAVLPIIWAPPEALVGANRFHGPRAALAQRIAAADYRAPWRREVPLHRKALLTRLDDDDGFAPDALARYQAAARPIRSRTALVLPYGIRVYRHRYSMVRHDRNAMHTLVTPPGDDLCVYDYGHTKVAATVRVVMVDDAPGWFWYRHEDTISGYRRADLPITRDIRRLFPVDWTAI